MCFSAETSFVAAGLLGIMGCATVKLTKNHQQLPLALLPWIFSFQQLNEGILWIFLGGDSKFNALAYLAQLFYLFIAYLLLLIWIPLSALLLEPIPWRRAIIGLLLTCGVALAILNADRLTLHQVVLTVSHHSIQYPFTDWTRGIPYALIVCCPFLLSSQPRMGWLGILGAIAFGIAYALYYWTVASVWCFFAALISILIYWVLRGVQTRA